MARPAVATPKRTNPTILVEIAHDYLRMNRRGIDWVLVTRALEGDIKAKRCLSDAEWDEALRQAAARRWPITHVCGALHISAATLSQRAQAARIDYWSATGQPTTTGDNP